MASGVMSITVLAAALIAAGCASQNPAGDGATRASSSGDLKAPTAQMPAVDVQVVTAQFGVFGADPNGRRLLYETDKFPAIPAAPYGWYILFKTSKPTVVWREEFEYRRHPPPGDRAKQWASSPSRRIARLLSQNALFRPGLVSSGMNGVMRRATRSGPIKCASISTASWFGNSASTLKKVRTTRAERAAARIEASPNPRRS